MNLKRVRWGVRGVLVLGVAASVVANVLHARDNPISQAIAAWPPLALLVTIELISRVPVLSRKLAGARLAATALIAGIAAWVSYWHMAGVAGRYGETGAAPYLIPLSVDGLVVVASVCLVELGGRIQASQPVESHLASHPGQGEVPVLVDGLSSMDFDVPLADPWLYSEPFGPEPATVEAAVGPPGVAPEPAEAAAQKVRQDERVSHEIDQLVRALRSTDPKMSRRRMAKLVQVSDTTIRRALERLEVVGGDQVESQPVPAINGHKVLEEVTR